MGSHVSPQKQDEQLSPAAPPGALLALGKLEGSRCRKATGPTPGLSPLPAQARSRLPGPADSATLS